MPISKESSGIPEKKYIYNIRGGKREMVISSSYLIKVESLRKEKNKFAMDLGNIIGKRRKRASAWQRKGRRHFLLPPAKKFRFFKHNTQKKRREIKRKQQIAESWK